MYNLASVCNYSYYFLLQGFTEPTSDILLPDLLAQDRHVFTLVLDQNETLVYSDWQVYCGFYPVQLFISLYVPPWNQKYDV